MNEKIKNNQKLLLVLAALVFLLGLSTVLASSQTLFIGESRLFTTINNWPDVLRVPMLAITYSGTTLFVLFVGASLILRQKWQLSARLVTIVAATYVVGNMTKHLIARPRPNGLISGVIVRQAETGYGFPSIHVALATVTAVILCRLLPKSFRWQLVVLWILLVALSRIYLGVHAPLDVVGGFALGGIMALVPDFLHVFYDKAEAKSKAHK